MPNQQPPMHSHLPVQKVHVQNIQAQNIQVQNVLVQPSVGLEQNIQGQHVQLQTVQAEGYVHNSAPYTNVQIQNIGPQVQQNKVETVEQVKQVKPETVQKKNGESVQKCPKNEPVSFLTPVSTFQIVTSVGTATTSFSTQASSHNYIMTYSTIPAKCTETQTNVIIGPELMGTGTVLVSQPMILNLEQAPNGEQNAAQFGGYVPVIYSTSVCCPTQNNSNNSLVNSPQKDSAEAKQARTPLVPSQHTHSPQLPIPSPNYPIQSQMVPESTDKTSESRNIPNRNVPILNNNYINSGNLHQSDVTSQARIGDKVDCLKSNGEKVTNENNEGNSGVVYSDSVNNNNELCNQVANLNNVNNDSSRHANDKMLCTQTYTQHDRVENGPQNTPSKDCDSLATKNQIVNVHTTPPVITLESSLQTEKPPPFTVLNVPTVSRFKTAQQQQPPPPPAAPPPQQQQHEVDRPIVSKLDMMTARRRERRSKRLKTCSLKPSANTKQAQEDTDSSVYTSSESESEDASKVDLWIKSGPPLKPDYKPEKLIFLKIFGLTTHYEKNEVELAKLEKRKWQEPWKPVLPDEGQPTCLDLPVPNVHPSVLNAAPDFGPKLNFLNGLGLLAVSDRSREERENTWMKILEDRRKRDGKSAFSTYCEKSYHKMQSTAPHKTNIPHNNGQYYKPPECVRFPVQNFLWQDIQETKWSARYPNGLRRNVESQGFMPYKRVTPLSVQPTDIKQEQRQTEKLKWPGIQEVMESYQRYAKECAMEASHLRHRCSVLIEQIRRKQIEADALERKLRELRSLRIFHEQERQQIEKTLNNLKRLVSSFR